MRAAWLLGLAMTCLALAFALGGTGPGARVLIGLGLPGLAAPLADDPGWRGTALYRAGDHDGAARAFQQAGMMLNLGNAHVQAGRYAAALEAYDMARLQGEKRAAANFDLVAAFYAGLALDPDTPIAWFTEKDGGGGAVVKSSIAQGSARAASTGDGATNTGALLGLPELQSDGARRVRKVFDDKFMVANRRWLQTLSDVPGDYLAARIRHERKRRIRLGLAQPAPEDPE